MKDSLVEQAKAVVVDELTDRDKAVAARAILAVRREIDEALDIAVPSVNYRSGSFKRGFTLALELILDVFADWDESSPVDPALTAAGVLYDTATEVPHGA